MGPVSSAPMASQTTDGGAGVSKSAWTGSVTVVKHMNGFYERGIFMSILDAAVRRREIDFKNGHSYQINIYIDTYVFTPMTSITSSDDKKSILAPSTRILELGISTQRNPTKQLRRSWMIEFENEVEFAERIPTAFGIVWDDFRKGSGPQTVEFISGIDVTFGRCLLSSFHLA
jgi:hypothetical protein